ncbi:hypothetical protein BOTBODRAFT_161425 [Botryobasidium botryosum FD-172 SS1]|uniref:Small-subunit processome Utp12 domain-containing protein n=1 Tax=Botryobasidium botryosum (strain FD-172 SS1) TaxID=930990 RepID=A0A067MDS5_BOTB1|nr:hypothetical protein BOTBODRAFT_161425 [Botryobasidium botryosum FD-172 SS1]
MAPASNKSKKSGGKPPRDRPTATGTIAQPVLVGTSSVTTLSAYSPDGDLFALVSLTVDKHRLRVFDTTTGRVLSEHILETSRVTALKWTEFAQSDSSSDLSSKKRKKRGSTAAAAVAAAEQSPKTIQVVALGLSDGSIVFFSPTHGKIIRTLSHPSSVSPILSLSSGLPPGSPLWSSSEDGTIRSWHSAKNEVLTNWKNDDRIPYTCLALRPGVESSAGQTHVLAARHNIRLFATPSTVTGASATDAQKPKELSSITGHSTPVFALEWDDTFPARESRGSVPSHRVVSAAENDRVINVWDIPSTPGGVEGKMVASLPLESDVRQIALAVQPSNPSSAQQTLLAVAASGTVSVFALPADSSAAASSKKDKSTVSTLTPQSIVSSITSEKSGSGDAGIVAATFSKEPGRIGVVRLLGGIKPVFDTLQYLDDSGNFIPTISVAGESKIGLSSAAPDAGGGSNRRYTESNTMAIRSGFELGDDSALGDAPAPIEGDLDVDLAELSLGQRLKTLSGEASAGEAAGGAGADAAKEGASGDDRIIPVPANALSRTLTQALHSSDARLLETCLAHSDQTIIRNTVQRLPPQLAVPLVTACVERLARGHRGANLKGGGGGASAQRGSALIRWVKAVLVVHTAHLMNIPDLVSRLSGLHATLSSRLLLQDRLLTLNGRLDLVLSQIDLRTAPAAPATQKTGKGKKRKTGLVTRYVEGESSDDEDEATEMEVEVEDQSGDEEGSVEDVELGGDSDEGDSVEEDEDEDEEDSDEDGSMNGFIDDEAEESYGEDESEEDDED